MPDRTFKIFPLGTGALTVEFGNAISAELNDKTIGLFQVFDENPFAGMIELVPAYASLTFFYDPVKVRNNFPEYSSAFDAVKNFAENALRNLPAQPETKPRLIEIPVDFGADYALDLDEIASLNGLAPEDVLKIFLARSYRVFMLGFLPGFAYLGEIDARIEAPRKKSPRQKVPRGSVGIAGRQTGIYPLASPGGWQIIGRTEIELFTPLSDAPTFLRPGDLVKFYAVN